MKLKRSIILLLPVLMLLVLIHACKKEAPAPANPYNSINRTDTGGSKILVDTMTITYVHQKVLSTRCALNGCHDGHFEPDYRTPQSAYATLLYAPIVKNDTAGKYKYRVIPYDTLNSVMYIRITNCCFVNNNDRMPQDNIGVPLPDSSIAIVRNWIMHGAKDMFGNIARRPNEPPVVQGFFAISNNYQVAYSNTRLDSIYYYPFLLADSVPSFYAVFQVTDDSTPVRNLQVNTLKLSKKSYDFSNAVSIQATYLAANGSEYWLASVPTAQFTPGDTVFMRYYVNDGQHPANTEFPNSTLPYPYLTYYSFIRQ